MAGTIFSCKDCGRVITPEQAQQVGKCMTCSQVLDRADIASQTAPATQSTPGLRRLGQPAEPVAPRPTESVTMRRLGESRPIVSEPEPPPVGTRSGVLRRPGASAAPPEPEPPPVATRTSSGLRRPGASAAAPPAPEAPPQPAVTRSSSGLRLRRDIGKEEQEGEWYASLGKGMMGLGSEKIRGPFSWSELVCLVANDTLKQQHKVRRGDDGDWQLAGGVPNLFGAEAQRQKADRGLQAKHARELEKQEAKRQKKYANASFDAGMAGGLFLMIAAGLWIGVGILFGVVFRYAVWLFIAGLITFCKGLFRGRL